MADDVDKFVLQYQIELKDSIERLEKLNKKIEDTNKKQEEGRKKDTSDVKKQEKEKNDSQKRNEKSEDAARKKQEREREVANRKAKKSSQENSEAVKKFANEAAGELSKVVPGIDKVTEKATGMGKAFGIATAALAVMGAGIGAVMNLREQYGKQRQTGMDVGVSALRMEEYQKKFQKFGGGYVTRDQTLEGVKAISDTRTAAYADPTRLGEQARLMRMIGIDVGALGAKPVSTNEIMTKLGARMAGGSEAQAQAIGAQFGLSQDFTKALRKMGSSVGEVTETTADDLREKSNTNKNLDKFNESVAKMNEELLKAANVIAEDLLPYVTMLTEKAGSLAKYLPAATKETGNALFEFGGPAKMIGSALGAAKDVITGKDTFGNSYAKRRGLMEYSTDEKAKSEEVKKEKEKEKLEGGGKDKTAKELIEDADKNNRDNKAATDAFQLAINMFAGSVSSFANAVDERQAWAAWAGEVGKAAGLHGAGEPTNGVPGVPGTPGAPGSVQPYSSVGLTGTTQYDTFYSEAAKRFKISEDLLKNVTRVESRFNPNAVSEVGAQGLMQIMPENSKKMGVKNPFDPRSNIMAGAEILSQNLKAAGGDVRQALMMYHGGYDRSAWGAKTQAYPDKVLNPGALSSKGESKANINLAALQQNVAQRLGVDLKQVQLGGVSKGDVSWTLNQKDAELQNKIIDLNRQKMTANLPKTEYDRIARETRETQMGLETLRKYRGNVEDKAKEGGRQITIGQISVPINITGSGSPEQRLGEIREAASQGVRDGLNYINDGKKM